MEAMIAGDMKTACPIIRSIFSPKGKAPWPLPRHLHDLKKYGANHWYAAGSVTVPTVACNEAGIDDFPHHVIGISTVKKHDVSEYNERNSRPFGSCDWYGIGIMANYFP